MSTLKTSDLPFEEKKLFVPELEEIKTVVKNAVQKNFDCVEVKVVNCPDLKGSNYSLVDCGLGGCPTILEVGGPPYLLPTVDRSKIYDIKEIVQKCMGKTNAMAIGAGAGPFPLRNANCEGIYNMKFDKNGTATNGGYTASLWGPDEECKLDCVPNSETRGALLLNLFLCHGKPGNVLKVVCKKRTGSMNFIECIRKGLEAEYKEKCVGMGGIFLIKKGRVRQHVMRDFSSTPIHTEEELNNWLKFLEMPAQLNAVGTLVTHEYDLDLRLQHFHSFSSSNWGGHYHIDTTPDVVEYEAYLNVAERLIRVDKPKETHKFGRD